MKIAVISYWSCPLTKFGVLSSGGMSVYLYNLCNTLGELGVQVDIYTRVHRENDEKILTIHKNIRLIHLSVSGRNPEEMINSFSNRLKLFMQKNELSYDLVHAHYYYSGLVAQNIIQGTTTPFIQTFHSLATMSEELGKDVSERKKSEKRIIERATAIIASTPFEKDDLVKKYQADPQKIHVVSPGVNHEVFRPINRTVSRKKLHLPKNKKIILFVGRIDPMKGLQFLIEAVSKLSEKYPHFQNNYRVLLIGGDIASQVFWQHPEVKKIKELILKKDIECCVKFLGSRPHSLLPYYYSASDVVVMPSINETFGLVALEAMACGSCVIASAVGGLQYLIKDRVNGRLFTNGSVEDLGSKLWELLKDPVQCKELGQEALQFSQKFCWSKQAEKIVKIYRMYE